jgi:hypothetical protein
MSLTNVSATGGCASRDIFSSKSTCAWHKNSSLPGCVISCVVDCTHAFWATEFMKAAIFKKIRWGNTLPSIIDRPARVSQSILHLLWCVYESYQYHGRNLPLRPSYSKTAAIPTRGMSDGCRWRVLDATWPRRRLRF